MIMRRTLLICIASVAFALTAGAQMPYNHRKAPQKTTTYSGYRSGSAVRQMPPQRTFSPARHRQPTYSNARFRQPMPGGMRVQPRVNNSFVNRPVMTNTGAWRRNLPRINNDWRQSRLSERPRPTSSFVDRPAMTNNAAWRQARLGDNNRWADSRFRERLRTNDSLLNRSDVRNVVTRPAARQPFNNGWANSKFRERNSSFVNRSRSTAFWSGTRAAVTNNWRGEAFAGRQYSAFRNYERQWHDSGWWHDHCGDRIVFVTVYSQPFPFYFDSGYWYPAWGYYPDSYYPYDGPIYGYNDLPPDEVIANVQTQLYNEGYYDGPIDGILGPDTRAAIADYQADHGLAVTSAIDEPTVESLGLG
jgi:Putative peptidoglycan binding domain